MMILSNNTTSNSGNYPSTLMNISGTTVQQQNSNIPPNPWIITALEQRQNEGQFVVLRPIAGMIYGEQARPFFLKSGLSASALAQIWQLSDLNKDGKLDRLEFSIAMKLIRNCIAGLPLPSTLPYSMRQISGDVPPMTDQLQFNGVENTSAPQPQMPPRPMSTYGISTSYRPIPHGGSYSAAQTPTMPPATFGASLSFQMGTKEMGDWSLPQPLKLRFCQQFNQLDRSRIGLLTGQQARGVLAESLLPTQVLAQIWNMSDVNKDGCLGIEEFCTAQFLIEMIKSGYALPSKLPNELYAFCSRSKTVSPSTVFTPNDPNAPPPQKAGSGGGHFKTFEDKRRDNLDKGQAELDRRRQILKAEEERRRAEIEQREREEAERKERERQEYERRREAELEIQRRRELELEKERAAEEERLKAQREEARRRLEIERIKELEKIRVRDLENQLEAETEKATQIQQRHRTISFQIQALDERSQQLNGDVTGVRGKILEITQEIEGMRELRDEKCAKIQELERKTKELTIQSERFSHENLQLQAECQRYLGKSNEIDSIRKESTSVAEEIKRLEEETQALGIRTVNQEKLVLEKRPIFEKSGAAFEGLRQEHNSLLDRYNKVRLEKYPNTQIQQSIAAPQHEIPPDSILCSTGERKASKDSNTSGFDDDFVAVFGNTATTSKIGGKQNMLDEQIQNLQNDNIVKSSFQQRQDHIPGTQQDTSHILLSATTAGLKTVKYKALYEFIARSVDELSLQPGDIILVFEGYQSEPGWLAGQIRDKVGWFPAAFAESVSIQLPTTAVLKKGNSLTGSPSTEPLASIQEEGSEFTSALDKQQPAAPFTADFTSAFSKSISLTDTTNGGVAATNSLTTSHSTNASFASFSAGAFYDLPPCDEKANVKSMPQYEIPPSDEPVKGDVTIFGTGIALYQWKARNEQEMTFGRGDIIEVLEQGELRWRGRLQKNKQIHGWFPKSYIKLGTTSLSALVGNNVSSNSNTPNQQISEGNVGNGTEKMANSAVDEKSSGEWFIALYQFDAVESTDLSLKVGDRIWVTDQREQWWRGTCGGRNGIFPSNYVQKASATGTISTVNFVKEKQTIGRAIAAFEATASNQISLHPGDIVRVHQITPGGWWEGELDRNGETHIGWFPGNYLQIISEHKNDAEAKPIAVAAFDYQAQHDDELSFKAGDLIEVLDNSDAQWWRGRKQGDDQRQLLLFPANFVQLQ